MAHTEQDLLRMIDTIARAAFDQPLDSTEYKVQIRDNPVFLNRLKKIAVLISDRMQAQLFIPLTDADSIKRAQANQEQVIGMLSVFEILVKENFNVD